MIYSLHEGRIPSYSKKDTVEISAIYSEGEVIKDCSYLITESMIEGCMNNVDLIRNVAILEGAKLDLMLSNFLKEGKDYKGLKKDLRDIIAANDMDKSELASRGKGFMHICKRILQVCSDLQATVGTVVGGGVIAANTAAAGALTGGAAIPFVLIGGIMGFVVGFICNRLMRLLVDTVEFNTIKKDAEDIVDDLRAKANRAENPEAAKKLNSEADKLEASIKKWSAKGKKD